MSVIIDVYYYCCNILFSIARLLKKNYHQKSVSPDYSKHGAQLCPLVIVIERNCAYIERITLLLQNRSDVFSMLNSNSIRLHRSEFATSYQFYTCLRISLDPRCCSSPNCGNQRCAIDRGWCIRIIRRHLGLYFVRSCRIS